VAEQFCSFDTAVTGNELVALIDEDRIVESKPLYGASDLLNLRRWMSPRIPRIDR
jgi:hypothetical protein